MITQPAKVFLPITALGLVAAVFYSGFTADHAGITLFVAIAAAALVAGVSITVAREHEAATEVAADAGPPQLKPAPAARLPGGPGWPALAALGTGFVVLSLIVGPAFAVPGAALAVVAAAGWLGSVASDRTGRVPNLLPLGIPVFGLFAIGSLMFLMSRILLAVPEQASTFIALAVAVLIMAVASFVALKPALSARAVMAGLIAGGLLMAGGGLVAAAVGQRDVEKHEVGPKAIVLEAKAIKFNRPEIDLAASQPAVVKFHNDDTVPHNVAVYDNADYSGQAFFQGAVVVGPTTTEYRFTAPPAGTYYFRCDIHPNMQGKVLVA